MYVCAIQSKIEVNQSHENEKQEKHNCCKGENVPAAAGFTTDSAVKKSIEQTGSLAETAPTETQVTCRTCQC